MGRILMRKISEIFRQRFELRLRYRDIARSLGISVTTVAEYLAKAKVAGITWPLPEGITEQELYDQLFLPARVVTRNRVTPEWQYIHQFGEKGREETIFTTIDPKKYKAC